MNDRSPVALIGFMTSGKSTIGPQLAMRLDLDFLDLDRMIVEQERATVDEIFATRGEDEFRAIETALLARHLGGPACVIATGGGIADREGNRRSLARRSTVVWLDLRFETVMERLREDAGPARPLVDRLGTDGLRDLHHRRRALYASCADLRVDADRDAPGRLARRIALHLRRAVRS